MTNFFNKGNRMKDIISVLKKIVPELIELTERRYTIMQHVSHSQPIGRRSLSNSLRLGERIVRSELEFLKIQGLLEGDSTGVKLTGEGEIIVSRLSEFVKNLRGLNDLENKLEKCLGLKQVILVPGDSDEDELVKKELGRSAARYLFDKMGEGNTIAVTGGSTLLEVANAISYSGSPQNVLVVPSRGGTGRDVEIQANTIAAKIAKKLKGSYRFLHVPDNLGEEAMKSLGRDPGIKDILKTIKSANILIHGIGNAEELSVSRGDTADETTNLMKLGAVGEAFGHYFAKNGKIVKTLPNLGIRLDDLKNIDYVVGVAGGRKKAEAILAVVLNGYETCLIADEAAGRVVFEQMNI